MGIKELREKIEKVEISPHFCTKEEENNVIWSTKEGKKFFCVCEIKTDHLINIVSFLKRRGKQSDDFRILLFSEEIKRRNGKSKKGETKTKVFLENNELGRKIRFLENT